MEMLCRQTFESNLYILKYFKGMTIFKLSYWRYINLYCFFMEGFLRNTVKPYKSRNKTHREYLQHVCEESAVVWKWNLTSCEWRSPKLSCSGSGIIRWICGVPTTDLLFPTGLNSSIKDVMRWNRMRFHEHLRRMYEDEWPKKFTLNYVDGRQRRGR